VRTAGHRGDSAAGREERPPEDPTRRHDHGHVASQHVPSARRGPLRGERSAPDRITMDADGRRWTPPDVSCSAVFRAGPRRRLSRRGEHVPSGKCARGEARHRRSVRKPLSGRCRAVVRRRPRWQAAECELLEVGARRRVTECSDLVVPPGSCCPRARYEPGDSGRIGRRARRCRPERQPALPAPRTGGGRHAALVEVGPAPPGRGWVTRPVQPAADPDDA
jgi:hypothetical protein